MVSTASEASSNSSGIWLNGSNIERRRIERDLSAAGISKHEGYPPQNSPRGGLIDRSQQPVDGFSASHSVFLERSCCGFAKLVLYTGHIQTCHDAVCGPMSFYDRERAELLATVFAKRIASGARGG